MGSLLPEKIYNSLRARLLAGEFKPGSRLDYRKISAEMDVSTTPVREAMRKLAAEGFVDLVPRAGAIIRNLGRQEAIDIYGVREAMEVYSVAKAAQKISANRLQQMDVMLSRMHELIVQASPTGVMRGKELAEFLEADLAFHMTIIESVGNSRLTNLAANSHIHSRIFGLGSVEHDLAMLQESEKFHRAIYEALKEHNGAKAAEELSHHINRSLEMTLAHLDDAQENSWRWTGNESGV